MLVDHGDEVILPVPYWVSFKDIVRYAGGKPVFVETDEAQNFALTAEMVRARDHARTKMIILNSPIESFGRGDEAGGHDGDHPVGARARHLGHLGRVLCVPELHGRRISRRARCTEYRERLVILGSLSKTYAMTGWRLGYALAPAADRQRDGEAAEPVDLEPDLDRAEGGGGGAEWTAGVRGGNARAITSSCAITS